MDNTKYSNNQKKTYTFDEILFERKKVLEEYETVLKEKETKTTYQKRFFDSEIKKTRRLLKDKYNVQYYDDCCDEKQKNHYMFKFERIALCAVLFCFVEKDVGEGYNEGK